MSSAKHTNSDLVDLTVDEDEDDVKMPAVSRPPSNEVVDLCGVPDVLEVLYQQNEQSTLSGLESNKKRRRLRHSSGEKTATAPSVESVIAIDVAAVSTASSGPQDTALQEIERYKSILGPHRMDFISEFQPKHAFEKSPQHPCLDTRKLFRELLEYKLNLPVQPSSSIFVRAMESRLDLLRIIITGPSGTPYEHGIFVFDCFLHNYPQQAPKVKFLTTGGGKVRFNPNLYNCGKVCLSLLGTWQGDPWIPNKSTLLQVLISIQGLVLVHDPFFNEPSYDAMRNAPSYKKRSEDYNRNIRSHTVVYAIRDCLRSVLANNQQKGMMYSEFAKAMKFHFAERASQIQQQLQKWYMDNPKTLKKLVGEVSNYLVQLDSIHKQRSPP